MKDLILYLIKNIANNPDEISIEEDTNETFIQQSQGEQSKSESENDTETRRGKYITYTVTVHPDDIPLVIGKNGRTIKSIRNLAKIKAIKDGSYVDVRVKTEG